MRVSFAIESTVIADRLVSEAARKRCDARQLAAAIVAVVLDGRLVDSILDGDDPRLIAGAGRRAATRVPIRERTEAVLLIIAEAIAQSEADGHGRQALLSSADIARRIKAPRSAVIRIIKALVAEGTLGVRRDRKNGKSVIFFKGGMQ